MDYTVQETNEKMKQLADKMGSEYFPLPVLLNFFETATFDFVGERLSKVELTQTITDDISNLVVRKDITVIESPTVPEKYIAPIPTNYLRRLAQTIKYADGTFCRKVDFRTQGEYEVSKLNPNTKPTKMYPTLLQEENNFQIDCGDAVPFEIFLTYGKKPTFGTTGTPTARIVNLPDDAIEKILKITTKNLFQKTGDQRQQIAVQDTEAYRKIFK